MRFLIRFKSGRHYSADGRHATLASDPWTSHLISVHSVGKLETIEKCFFIFVEFLVIYIVILNGIDR